MRWNQRLTPFPLERALHYFFMFSLYYKLQVWNKRHLQYKNVSISQLHLASIEAIAVLPKFWYDDCGSKIHQTWMTPCRSTALFISSEGDQMQIHRQQFLKYCVESAAFLALLSFAAVVTRFHLQHVRLSSRWRDPLSACFKSVPHIMSRIGCKQKRNVPENN